MILGTKARYAVMAMVELAGHEPEKPVTLPQLAAKQEFTVPYLEQIFSKLKQAGLVRSVRGPGGGYVLAWPAKAVRISQIVQAVDESLKMTRCDNAHKASGCMASGSRCLTHDLWDGLEQQIFNYLDGITLADVRQRRINLLPGFLNSGNNNTITLNIMEDSVDLKDSAISVNNSYLDYNATAPVRPQVLARMQELQAGPLNPSSVHRFGRDAKKHLENARKTIAEAIAAWPNEIIFTASGTEANATVLKGFPDRRILVSAVEHSSLLSARRDGIIPVTSSGIIDLAALDAMLADSRPTLISVMLANNETGAIQPIAEIAAIAKNHGALVHTDAVQALGKIPVDFGALSVDLMTISGHKCGGPLGAAALVVRRELPFQPLLTGGGQELGRRAGTENVAAVAGLAKAVEGIDCKHMQQVRGWLELMEDGMEASGGILFAKNAPRLPNTSCVAMPGVSNEVQLMDFDLKGFAVSAGSACSSGRIEGSHVLNAMGIEKSLVSSAIRVSGGWKTTENDIILFTECWKKTFERLNKRRE